MTSLQLLLRDIRKDTGRELTPSQLWSYCKFVLDTRLEIVATIEQADKFIHNLAHSDKSYQMFLEQFKNLPMI